MKLAEEMFAMVQSWQKSEMTKKEFLSDKAIGESKFDYWLYKYRHLRSDICTDLPTQRSPDDFQSFILSEDSAETDRGSISMEIVTPSGVRITFYH